ncbi:MAG TPA: SUMF1/EgtB/PvdO family nonheme iron enzyme [Labilithrix sp.]|nr:SUMF1/EgtB/PvdO family nonheme iron enzyme [Labilithrix sp.]
MSAWPGDISRVVASAAIAVVASACSSPAVDAIARPQVLTSSLAAPVVSGGSSEPRARSGATPKETLGADSTGRCPRSMVPIEGRFCIDRYEAALVDVLPSGEERAHSPFEPVIAAQRVRAVSSANVYPQGYISAVEAQRACSASGKRLCRVAEWSAACRGPDARPWGYGDRREPGRCNDQGKNPVLALYGRGHWNWSTMNQPDLNQLASTLAKTGEHDGCTNGYGVYDMVGNLHEWVADPSGTFYGGYYQDVASVGHGEGCGYQTTAHEARYHDYSTGFRCCAEIAGRPADPAAASRRPRQKR